MANKKVVIGCEGFQMRKQIGNGVEEPGKLTKLPGLQEVGLELESDQESVYADDVKALVLNSGITGAKVTGNFMELSSEERANLLGVEIRDGMEVYSKDLVPPYVSVSWKYKCNDGSFIYMGATRGNFGVPDSKVETQEEKPEQKEENELEGTFIPREDGVVFVRVHDKTEGFREEKFLKLIHGDDAVTAVEEKPVA
ncbi:major tail protein [Staphylococcus warneri]|uniref:major tail protein n=1 Tax=Staphylococcus warneri TaxID=1292 RepID=UPI0030BAE2D7